MVSWKNYHQKNKTNLRLRKAVFGLLIAGIGVVFVLLFQMFRFITSVNRNDSTVNIPSVPHLNFTHQINIFISPNWIIGVDAKNNELKTIQVPDEQKNSDLGVLSNELRVVIDGYLLSSKELSSAEELANYLRSQLFASSLRTNFSRWQIFEFWWSVKGNMLIQSLTNSLPEDAIAQNDYAISVLNGTSQSGLASDAAQWLENLGTEVTEIGNTSQTYETNYVIYYGKETKNPIIDRLEKIFKTQVIFDTDASLKPYDVQIIVGTQYGKQ